MVRGVFTITNYYTLTPDPTPKRVVYMYAPLHVSLLHCFEISGLCRHHGDITNSVIEQGVEERGGDLVP